MKMKKNTSGWERSMWWRCVRWRSAWRSNSFESKNKHLFNAYRNPGLESTIQCQRACVFIPREVSPQPPRQWVCILLLFKHLWRREGSKTIHKKFCIKPFCKSKGLALLSWDHFLFCPSWKETRPLFKT